MTVHLIESIGNDFKKNVLLAIFLKINLTNYQIYEK